MELTTLFFVPSLYSLHISVTVLIYIPYLLFDCNLKADLMSYFVSVRMKKKGRDADTRRENCHSPLIPSVCTICPQFDDTEFRCDAEPFPNWFQAAQLHLQAFLPMWPVLWSHDTTQCSPNTVCFHTSLLIHFSLPGMHIPVSSAWPSPTYPSRPSSSITFLRIWPPVLTLN